MTIYTFNAAGSLGLVGDSFPVDLPQDGWTSVNNMRFKDGFAEKCLGYSTLTTSPSTAPYQLFFVPNVVADFLVYVGLTKAYAWNYSTWTEITPAAGNLTGSATDRITGGMFNGILIVHNRKSADKPLYWVPSTSNDLTALGNWPSPSYGGATQCAAIRPFKNHLIAMNLATGSGYYPMRVHWSNAADPGAVPDSWDETDTTQDAGFVDLAEEGSEIIDGQAFHDIFYIGKKQSVWGCEYIGPPNIFSFRMISSAVGLLSQNCFAETPVGVVMMTQNDIVLLNGYGTPQSILDQRNRRWLQANMGGNSVNYAFAFYNDLKGEVWCCYSSDASAKPDFALVWNVAENIWSKRSLPNVTSGVMGTHASHDSTRATFLASPTNTKIYEGEYGNQADGSPMTATLERRHFDFGDSDKNKMIRSVRPRIDGTAAGVVNIYVGEADDPNDTPTYSSALPFTIGTDYKVDVIANARYISFKFESTTDIAWRMKSFDVDVLETSDY